MPAGTHILPFPGSCRSFPAVSYEKVWREKGAAGCQNRTDRCCEICASTRTCTRQARTGLPAGGCGKIPLRCPAPLRGRSAARAVPVQSFAPLSARCVRLLAAVSSAPIPPNAHRVVIDDTFHKPCSSRCTARRLHFGQPAKEFQCGCIQKSECEGTNSRS